MPEFMVHGEIRFGGMPQTKRDQLLHLEAMAFAPFVDAGNVERVWHTHGDHRGDHDHLAIWNAPDGLFIERAYQAFPPARSSARPSHAACRPRSAR